MKYNVKTIELGVQSADNYILSRCKRGHTFEDVIKASKLIRRKRFILGQQMMVGLPDSTEQDEINTCKALIKLKPKIVRIYPVLVIKGTELEEEYKKGDYKQLADEIEMVISNRALGDKLSANALKTTKKRFTMEENVRHINDVICKQVRVV